MMAAERARGLERAVGEHAVIAERHAERGEHVEADHQAQLERADGAIPEQHDGHDQADEGERDADQVGDFVRAGHHQPRIVRLTTIFFLC